MRRLNWLRQPGLGAAVAALVAVVCLGAFLFVRSMPPIVALAGGVFGVILGAFLSRSYQEVLASAAVPPSLDDVLQLSRNTPAYRVYFRSALAFHCLLFAGTLVLKVRFTHWDVYRFPLPTILLTYYSAALLMHSIALLFVVPDALRICRQRDAE